MEDADAKPSKLLLHACCGPCSMEPVRVLRERGVEPVVHYANSNIAPDAEYRRRFDTIQAWAKTEGLALVEGEYDPKAWEAQVGAPWRDGEVTRKERCRACYRLRFTESAAYAAENGFDALGTTLSVSPYQYTDVIREELERACERAGIKAAFEDWRPHYDEATRRSREAGMYRQNYCGCAPSKAEAARAREERKAARAREREQRMAERAGELAEEERALQEKRRKRAEYDAERARRRQVLKELRQKAKHEG